MPAKRPVPLSDAALGHKQSIGETNDGHPLPVKNTFIDVHTPTDGRPDGQPVSTAPAQAQRMLHLSLCSGALRVE